MFSRILVRLTRQIAVFIVSMISFNSMAFTDSVHSPQEGLDSVLEPVREYLNRLQYDYYGEPRKNSRLFNVEIYGSCSIELFELRVHQVEIARDIRETLSFNHCTSEIDTIQMSRSGIKARPFSENDLLLLKGVTLSGLDSFKMEFPWDNTVVRYRNFSEEQVWRFSIYTRLPRYDIDLQISEKDVARGRMRTYRVEYAPKNIRSYSFYELRILKDHSGANHFYISAEEDEVTQARFNRFYKYTVQQMFVMINSSFSQVLPRWPVVKP